MSPECRDKGETGQRSCSSPNPILSLQLGMGAALGFPQQMEHTGPLWFVPNPVQGVPTAAGPPGTSSSTPLAILWDKARPSSGPPVGLQVSIQCAVSMATCVSFAAMAQVAGHGGSRAWREAEGLGSKVSAPCWAGLVLGRWGAGTCPSGTLSLLGQVGTELPGGRALPRFLANQPRPQSQKETGANQALMLSSYCRQPGPSAPCFALAWQLQAGPWGPCGIKGADQPHSHTDPGPWLVSA